MAIYSYQARNRRNQLVEGIVDALSEETVAQLLAEKDLTIITIKTVNTRSLNLQLARFVRHVRGRDLVIFFRQLAIMIEANVPIVKALRILVRQTENKYLKTVIAGVTEEVDGGARLSDAMSHFPDVFNNFIVNITRSGETSGRLSEVVNYLADQQEKDYDLKAKITGAMIYPAFILMSLFVVGLILMTFVVPQMTAILEDSGVPLPLITRILIAISSFLNHFWWGVLVALIALFFGGNTYLRTPTGRRFIGRIQVKAPIVGGIFQRMYIVRITQSLSTLLRGGVPVAKALAIVRDVVKYSVYETILTETLQEVEEGNLMANSLATAPAVPIMVSQMISIGEETGELEKVLDKVTEFYSREIDNSVRNLSVLIEPVIMILLGIAVGGFIAAIILPMWQLSSSF
ncbi:MAG: type II secretion system F family protein [Candidatus Buchananbacteria bacterium]|nr:type II secretion system F family protein [Candidatus Buchananbacteria bacterium]